MNGTEALGGWRSAAYRAHRERDDARERLALASEFRIPCPEPTTGGPGHPEDLVVQRRRDGRADGWLILNPNAGPGDHVWTGSEWVYRGELHRDVIYKWERDEAITEAQRLAPLETARYEAWITGMRTKARQQ